MSTAKRKANRSFTDHSWDLTPKEAMALQKQLSSGLQFRSLPRPPRTVAGADISHLRFGNRAVAGVVVLSFPDLKIIDESLVDGEITFPYVPGLLSFREGPLLEKAFSRLQEKPDLVFFDGQGIAHPRGLGIASHLGLRLGLRTVGCAKSRLWGQHLGELPDEKGRQIPLRSPVGDVIGAVLRTRKGVKPVYISPGYLVNLKDAVHYTLAVSPQYRIPVPVRAAHNRTNEERRRLGII